MQSVPEGPCKQLCPFYPYCAVCLMMSLSESRYLSLSYSARLLQVKKKKRNWIMFAMCHCVPQYNRKLLYKCTNEYDITYPDPRTSLQRIYQSECDVTILTSLIMKLCITSAMLQSTCAIEEMHPILFALVCCGNQNSSHAIGSYVPPV